jgi:hypothetical protein
MASFQHQTDGRRQRTERVGDARQLGPAPCEDRHRPGFGRVRTPQYAFNLAAAI